MMLKKGEWVWLDSSIGVAIGARVKVASSGQRTLVDDDGKEQSLSPQQEASLKIMHPTSVEGVDDMIKLGDMTEAGLLRNLWFRHKQGLIYTYTGSVLVAMNPYQVFPLYSPEQVKLYHGRQLGELPPHIFAIAESSYANMIRNVKNQCCIISGESGAGKTESTKLILQYLAAVSGEITEQRIEQQILESNPILEAFGNAKTIRNDNSSRFGKYLEIFFSKDGLIQGARVEQYLLEKSRVCHQAPGERNYHMFYCMLAGITDEEKKTLSLKSAKEYKFLTKGDCIKCEVRDDANDYKRIRAAMKILTFSESQCQEILKLLAAILHLGNICFESNLQNNLETSDVSKSENFNIAASLMEVQNSSLANSLTHRSFMTNREQVTKSLSSIQAADCRDALVKAIYNKLFIWIVGKINHVTYKKLNKNPQSTFLSIGLLDIFGFENFQTNSFEQLCINFANEKLQQFFVGHIFKLEQEQYLKEGIVWNNLKFSDNQNVLDLLAGKSCNLLALIDEESQFPKGTDSTLLTKMNHQHSGNTTYIASKNEHDTDFGIHHFAGVVQYDSTGFLEKNRDAVSSDLIKMVEMSTNKLLRQIFESELSTNGAKMSNKKIIIISSSSPKSSLRGQTDKRKQVPTLSGQFRQSLDSLMKTLSLSQPYFIRCFKPNNDKKSEVFNRELCIRQLRYSGMMDTIRIRNLGYPIRHTFEEFLKRYRVLLKTTVCDPKTAKPVACCEAICNAVIEGEDEWKIGKTKIFLKDAHDALLERLREQELSRVAVVIQRIMMGIKDRKSFLKKREAALVLQKNWRAYRERKVSKKLRGGYERLVSKIHSRKIRVQHLKERAAAVTIQTQVRGYKARKDWKQKRAAVILLQAHTRGFLARRLTERIKSDEQIALDLKQRLEDVIAESEQAYKRAESISEQDLGENKLGLRSEQEASKSDESEMARNMSELMEEICGETSEPESEINIPASDQVQSRSPSPPPSQSLFPSRSPFPSRTPSPPRSLSPSPPRSPSPPPPKSPSPSPPPPQSPSPSPSPSPAPAPASALAPGRARALDPAPDSTQASMPTTPTPSLEEDDDEFDDGSDEWSFYRFSILHFQSNTSHTHIDQRLKLSLLKHDDEGDALACLTIWWIILRFMEDIPEPKYLDSISQTSSTISRPVPTRQGRRLSNLVGLDQKFLRKNKKKYGTRKASAILEEPEDLTEEQDILIGEGPTLDRPLSALEKLHIILGYALTRRGIRDEIYCQICKQLVNNRTRKSVMLGWTLLSICLGIFPPSDVFLKYLENFIRRGPSGYREYCAQRLRRIIANGERTELPCWIEMQAAKTKEPINVPVTLMDGQTISLPLDSSSTSAEVCQAVANKINLKDTYGFSLYISLFDKMWSLGSCEKHVFDAVSQCEQEMRRQGREEKNTPWKLSIRKEMFTPWHDGSVDPISTDLIYRQVIKGIKMGEYTCDKEDDYVELAAKHYYIQFGSEFNKNNVQKVVEECIATQLIEKKSMANWIQLISAAHLQGPYMKGTVSKETVKGEIIDITKDKWPLDFSRLYEVTMTSGPLLPTSSFVVAVNSTGIFFMEGRDRRLLDFPYIEVKDVQSVSDSTENSVRLSTVRGDFVLNCDEAVHMATKIEKNLDGLRERSVFALVQQETNKPDDPTFVVCKRGDLLLVEKDEEHSPDENWIKVTNQRTTSSGVVYKDTVQFLPTLDEPSEETLDLLIHKRTSTTQASAPQRDETVAPVSLKEFALEHFRPPGKEVSRHGASRGIGKEKLWACSKEPIKQPLMKNLLRFSDLSTMACNAFTAIMKYMGDYPIKNMRSPIDLTDQIFGPATQHEALQDEIYCQIMRQMSSNNNRLSMERGWQLLWLCSGLFPPSPNLMAHAKRFLQTRPRDTLSPGCLQRLQDMVSKEPRKLPPHQAEVDAIQQNSTQIFHKIHLPNDKDDIFEVTSTTTIQDLCCTIASELKLKSSDGYGLYLKTLNKVQSLEDDKYFFDNLRQTSDTPKKTKKGKEGITTNMAYLVIMKRKLWFNVSPGKDLVADLTFHFPQEVPRYLRGYHSCTKEDMITLGGLLFRSKVDSDRTQFVMIPRMLKDLVPANQIDSMSSEDWKKHIISSYNKQSGMTVQEAKIAFLKAISGWPTFGCSFFEVKQTCESSYPSTVLVIISKQGVSLTDPQTKEVLVMHPFSRITDYGSEGNFFEMTIGTLIRGYTFVCETTQAFTMEDLLRSYVTMYEKQRTNFRPRTSIFA